MPIEIAHMPATLNLDGLPAAQQALLHDYYGAFRVPAAPGGMCVRMYVEPGPPFIAPEGHRCWQVRTAQAAGRVTFQSFFEAGWIDRDAGIAEVTMRPNGNPENFLRVLFAWEALARGSLLVHASGVIRGGRGFVFFGPSGAGKTTLARFAADATVLSDDLVILGWEAGQVHVYGVPFRGEMAEAPRTNAHAPLQGPYSPVKAAEHALTPLTPADALARLTAAVPFVMAQPAAADQVLSVCTAILAATPAYALHFCKDGGFWALLQPAAMAAAER